MNNQRHCRIDVDRCSPCNRCMEACPIGCIWYYDYRPAIQEEACNGCGECANVCDCNAIVYVD